MHHSECVYDKRKRIKGMEKNRLPKGTQKGLEMVGHQQMKASNDSEVITARSIGNQKQCVALHENWNEALICRE